MPARSRLATFARTITLVLFTFMAVAVSHLGAETYEPGVYEALTGLQKKGYDPKQVYLRLDGTDIDAFNFNFVMSFDLPIGLSYPENAGISLDLGLTYNSRIWSTQHDGCKYQRYVRIRRDNPVGLGFDFSLGRIVKRTGISTSQEHWTYIGPDGAPHSLHDAGSGVYLTHDGSHLRATEYSDHWKLELPNGVVHEFWQKVVGPPKDDVEAAVSCCDPEQSNCNLVTTWIPDASLDDTAPDRDWVGWHVTKVYSKADVSQHSYSISYQTYPDDPQEEPRFGYIPKTITDQHGRTISVLIDEDDQSDDFGLVKQIITPAPPDAVGQSRTATYEFHYGARTMEVTAAGGNYNHDVRVLERYEKPEVAAGEKYMHEFDYTDLDEFGVSYYGGQLESVTYPSGHQATFTYQMYWYTVTGGNCEIPKQESPSWGVASKTKTADGNTLAWTFSQGSDSTWYPVSGNCESGDPIDGYWLSDQRHTMVGPDGNTTQMLFRTPWGLPVTQEAREEQKKYGLLLSLENYEANTLVKQETYKNKLIDEMGTDYDWVKKRIDTYYHDDTVPGIVTQLTEERSKFDSFGHHQETIYSGNAIGERRKIVVTDYLSDNEVSQGSPCIDGQTALANWRGNLLVREEILYSDDEETEVLFSQTRHGYDLDKGLRTKTVAKLIPDTSPDVCESMPTPASGDIVTSMTYTDDGDLWTKQIEQFGSGGTVFGWVYEYADGALESQKNDGLNFFDFVRTIDPDTGLVLEEMTAPVTITDPDAVVTSYEYDILGRTTQVAVGDNLEPLTITYENDSLDPAVGSYGLARIRSSRGTVAFQIETVEHYDKLGRIERVDNRNPWFYWSYQHTEYDDAGRVAFVSEWTGNDYCAPSCAESLPGTHTDYTTNADGDCDPETGSSVSDALGRPGCVKGPLGEITKYDYWGTNKTVTVENIAIAGKDAAFDSNTAPSVTKYYTDGLGRLRAVDSPDLEGGTTAESLVADAIYDYDSADRLVKVNLLTTDLVPNPSATDRYAFDNNDGQIRSFTFDDLGRQTTSTHPESGLVKTFEWNALGSPTKVQDALGLARGHHHETTYDAAGRPTDVHRVLDSTETPLDETLAADTSWTATDWGLTPGTVCMSESDVWWVGEYVGGSTGCTYGHIAGKDNPAILTTPSLPATGTLPEGATLSFRYFREVRDQVSSGGTDDRLRVLVREKDGPIWTEILTIDASQHSWSRWKRSPAIPLDNDAWLGEKIEVQFEFTAGSVNGSAAKGIAISDVKIQKPQSVHLSATEYDTDLTNCDDDGSIPNLSNGKVVRAITYDESTGAPSFTKELCYEQSEGQLSKEGTILDWDRDGQTRTFESTYSYNDMAQLSSQVLPHLASEPEEDHRQINYVYWAGKLNYVTSSIGGMTQQIVEPQGFAYNNAGGLAQIRFTNRTSTNITPNQAHLPHQITTTRDGVGTPLFDTGLYEYDGARNIKKIGSDVYRYDLVGRLRRAKVVSENFGSGLYLDYRYDHYGNMTDRLTSLDPLETQYSPTGPDGLNFGSRSYDDAGDCDNRIHDTGFEYDDNGNLIEEPLHSVTMGDHRYSFTPENRMTLVRPLGGGEIYQESRYDAGGDRWVRVVSSDGGQALITLRDASGQVVAEYVEDPSVANEPVAHKHYVHGNGKLLATHSVCGPSPVLTLPDDNEVPGEITLDVGFAISGITPQELVVHIEDDTSGQYTTKTLPGTTTQFTLDENDLFTGENLIRVRAEMDCGTTGYSNGVSYQDESNYTPGSSNCIAGTAVVHREWALGVGDADVRSTIHIQVNDKYCHPSHKRNVYYRDEQGQEQILAYNVTEDDYYLPDTPPGAGHGKYWFATNMSPDPDVPGPEASNDEDNAGGGSAGIPGSGMWKTEYVHSDHLGSTRLVTDEAGIEVASYKYYPFGLEAETSSGTDLRMKFTGHERDSELALDYMKARYCGPALGRFLSVDPADDSDQMEPGRYNRYAYVANDPVNLIDKSGLSSDEYHEAESHVEKSDRENSDGSVTTSRQNEQRSEGGWSAEPSGQLRRMPQGSAGGEPATPSESMESSLLDLSANLNKEVNVHSGQRTPAQNASIPGAAPSSQHVTGDAADISVTGMSGRQTAQAAHRSGEFSRTNLYSDGRVHVDQKPTTGSGYYEGWKRRPSP